MVEAKHIKQREDGATSRMQEMYKQSSNDTVENAHRRGDSMLDLLGCKEERMEGDAQDVI